MARYLTPATTPTEQYASFTAAEAIRAGDIVALGEQDGKAYYLNDPAVSDTISNNLRNFSMPTSVVPKQLQPVVSVAALPVTGAQGWVKTALLANGNTVMVYATLTTPATWISSNSVNTGSSTFSLYFVIIDPNGAQVAGPTMIEGNAMPCSMYNSIPSSTYSSVMNTGVSVVALPAGGFAVSYIGQPQGQYQILLTIYSNAGVKAGGNSLVQGSGPITYGIPYCKLAVLANGNLVIAYANGRGVMYDSGASSYQTYGYSHYFAIYTPTGAAVVPPVNISAFYLGSINGSQSVGRWASTRPFSVQLLTFPNGNFALAGVITDWGFTAANVISRKVVTATYTSTGQIVLDQTIPMDGQGYVNNTHGLPTADGYVLGCTLSSGSALLCAGNYSNSVTGIYSLTQTGVLTLLRASVVGGLTPIDGGDSLTYGIASLTNGFYDLYPYGMTPYGTGALLILNQNEQILGSNGATLAIASNIGAAFKPQTAACSIRYAIAPQIMTTNIGQFLTVTATSLNTVAASAAAVPVVPIIGGVSFGAAVALKVNVNADGMVKSVTSMANPQSTAANCYQMVLWDRSGFANTYTYADAVQGMTFIGVAKFAAAAAAKVQVQTLGQAKLRIPLSKPIIVDTRRLLPSAAAGAQNTFLQENTFGTLATMFGDTATLKGTA